MQREEAGYIDSFRKFRESMRQALKVKDDGQDAAVEDLDCSVDELQRKFDQLFGFEV